MTKNTLAFLAAVGGAVVIYMLYKSRQASEAAQRQAFAAQQAIAARPLQAPPPMKGAALSTMSVAPKKVSVSKTKKALSMFGNFAKKTARVGLNASAGYATGGALRPL